MATITDNTSQVLDSPFAPEADDNPSNIMEVSTEQNDVSKPENEENPTDADNLAENVEQLRVSRVQKGPQWTNDELYRLMEACEIPKTWESRAQSLVEEFGKNHPEGFFTTETCIEKYKRLTGESENKPANKELLQWIKQFLKRAFNERHAHGEAARLARVRRFYELTMHALNDRLTEDQISELVGIDLYNDFVTDKLTEPNREGREEWLHADLFSSKLSHEEWKSARNPEDLINKLRTQPINKSRLTFQHHGYKIQLLEEMAADKEKSPIVPERSTKVIDESNLSSIRSPPGRRSEALASTDSLDHQSIISSDKSPDRKRRRKFSKTTEGVIDLDKIHPVKRENESPEVILYEPNIISSPTRVSASTLTSPPTQVDAETIIESTKRQLRQRSDSKRSSATASPDVAKMEIKRENSEEVQSMEVDENVLTFKYETSECSTQTILTIRQSILGKRASNAGETGSTRSSRRSNVIKKAADKLPLKLPMTIQCRHSEMQTDSINSKDLNGHVLIFTDAKVEDDTIVKLEEKMANEFKAENSSSELDKSIPSASTRKQRRDKQDTEMSALKAKTKALQPKTSPKEIVAVIMDEETMNQIYPNVRLPEPDESVDEQAAKKPTKETKERPTPARRSRRSGVATQEDTSHQETSKSSVKRSPEHPIQIATLYSEPSISRSPLPGPVTPNQKTLLLSAHNLVIGHPKAPEFRERVTDDVVAGYSDVIKHPMDLNTIKTLIDENKIKTLTELNDHYLLMCMNAIMFNDDGHTVNQDARELKLFCAQTIQNMRHPTARKAAQRLSARRLTTSRAGGGSTSSFSGTRPFIQTSGANSSDSRSQFIRKTFVHSPNYHRVRKIKAPPME